MLSMATTEQAVALITARDRSPGPTTPGMVREQAVATDQMWSGLVRTDPGMVSGWHHHGDYETTIYVVSGIFRIESGTKGDMVHEAQPGDFVYVPPRAIHREVNPAAEPSEVVVVRAGRGESVFNLDGPMAG